MLAATEPGPWDQAFEKLSRMNITEDGSAVATYESGAASGGHKPNGDGQPSADMAAVYGYPHADQLEVDTAILQALAEGKERATVLRIEDLVEKFVRDAGRQILEFPPTYTNYQRMLAHRIAQHFGCETSAVDRGNGQGSVVARKTASCKIPSVKLADINPQTGPRPYVERHGPKAILPRPASQEANRQSQGGLEVNPSQSPSLSAKDKEDDYMQARERIVGRPNDFSGGRHGRFAGRLQNGMAGRTGPQAGRGRKAVFHNRDRDLQDPDYRRAPARFPPTFEQVYDPSVQTQYGVGFHPAYQPEVVVAGAPGPSVASPDKPYRPEYGMWVSAAVRPPPPPPPPNPPSTGRKPPQGVPSPVPGGGPLAMSTMVPRPYAGMPVGPFGPMHGMQMGFPMALPQPGAPGIPPPPPPQAMYAPGMPGGPVPYGGIPLPPGCYGYMPPPMPGQEMMGMGPGPFAIYGGFQAMHGFPPHYAHAPAHAMHRVNSGPLSLPSVPFAPETPPPAPTAANNHHPRIANSQTTSAESPESEVAGGASKSHPV